VLADARGEVQQRACYAIEAFCEHLGSDMLPFLAPLLHRLTTLLQQSQERQTQERAVSAIAAVAVGSKADFAPYFDGVYALMRHLLTQSASDMLVLRARAMECVGLMCLAVGRAACGHVLSEAVGIAMGGLQIEAPELREYTFGFFAQLAELMGAEFAPLLPPLLPHLVRYTHTHIYIYIYIYTGLTLNPVGRAHGRRVRAAATAAVAAPGALHTHTHICVCISYHHHHIYIYIYIYIYI